MSRILVRRQGETLCLEARDGENLLEALRRGGINIAAPCGGMGKCGKCRVLLSRGGSAEQASACRTVVDGDCELWVQEAGGGEIYTASRTGEIKLSPGRSGLGAAVDIGTTTIALRLFDLADGRLLGSASAWNAQAPYGADVLSRCQYIIEHEDGLERLSCLIREQLMGMLLELCRESGAEPEDIRELYAAGNTVMEHIFAGLSPAGIAKAPFRPESLFESGEGFSLGKIKALCAPCVAGFVGGDITAGLLAAGLHERSERSLFLDIGTNGEMALGGKEGFLCCAVACGPAFEGAGIACGMAGTPGAISGVSWESEEPEYQIIGGGSPKGICGSGLIDLLAALLEKGIVSGSGRLLGPEEAPEGYEKWLGEDENGLGRFYLTEDGSIYLSAGDVRQLQLAKAAVAAGIRTLMRAQGLCWEDIHSLYLAGGFGNYLKPRSAAAIGMLPEELCGRIVFLGNTALAGAQEALLDMDGRSRLLRLRRECSYLELSGRGDFNDEFTRQMIFYEEDDEQWN